ncbi:ResA resolvase [Klebsiella variicola]|uniref:ResA resolvase n=1 Tax=Klebsiella variicola TaxID=244366 RepID=A0A7H4M7G2_KLEVA|nr:ResA resolvase [Klebsiella variicola]
MSHSWRRRITVNDAGITRSGRFVFRCAAASGDRLPCRPSPCARWRSFRMNCRNTCWRRKSAPCSIMCPICTAKCCWRRCGTPGARINEALALTRGDFSLAPPYPFVQLATLKQRTEKAARTAGRAPAGSQAHRLVPLSDHHYVSQLQMMVATLKIPLERRNKRTGRMEKARIWEITDRTVRTWLSEAVESAAADGVTFSVPVTPPYVPSLLRDAHAVCRHTTEGFAEPDGPQID